MITSWQMKLSNGLQLIIMHMNYSERPIYEVNLYHHISINFILFLIKKYESISLSFSMVFEANTKHSSWLLATSCGVRFMDMKKTLGVYFLVIFQMDQLFLLQEM